VSQGLLHRLLSRLFDVEEIDGDGRCPTYLYRWTLLRLGAWLAIYLHKFVGDDWSLDLHDHPKRFISIGLWGWYIEQTPVELNRRIYRDLGGLCETCRVYLSHSFEQRVFRAPWIRTFPATHVHRLSGPTPERPCWTLVLVGRPSRSWGFWNSGRFIPWKKYLRDETLAHQAELVSDAVWGSLLAAADHAIAKAEGRQ
jgi:hypothetical protein